jgi:hypothetical protein
MSACAATDDEPCVTLVLQTRVDACMFFICTHTGMEGNSPMYFKKQDIDRAARDKLHKTFASSLAMKVHFIELPHFQKRVIFHEDVLDTGASPIAYFLHMAYSHFLMIFSRQNQWHAL